MKVAGIETVELLPRDRITEIELVRAHDIAFTADAEEFRLDGVAVQLRINLLGEDLVERVCEPLPGCFAIGGKIFVPIGNPEIRDYRFAKLPRCVRSDSPARFAMLDPVTAHLLISMRKCEA